MTAQAIQDAQKAPKPPLIVSSLLREQNFGVAEGKPWARTKAGVSLEDHFSKGIYPALPDRAAKFPRGESLDDLRRRAEQAMEEILSPYIRQVARKGASGANVVVVSHGLFINEIVAVLLRKNLGGGNTAGTYIGLRNTGWTRMTVKVQVILDHRIALAIKTCQQGAVEGEGLEISDSELPPLEVRVTDLNRHEHTNNIVSPALLRFTAPLR
jgi:broad specificity phosphatase PhoE